MLHTREMKLLVNSNATTYLLSLAMCRVPFSVRAWCRNKPCSPLSGNQQSGPERELAFSDPQS